MGNYKFTFFFILLLSTTQLCLSQSTSQSFLQQSYSSTNNNATIYNPTQPLSFCGDRCQIGQVCRNATCSGCFDDSECHAINDQWICEQQLCVHKTLFHNEISYWDIIGFVLLFLGCALSSGGGVGGGGIYIPILILVSKWDPKSSIPLSNCLVAGCSLANLIQNFPRRHPHANRHLIDFSVALLIEPLTLAGTIFGVYLHTYFPPLVILLLLVVTLGFTSYKTISKGVDLYKSEMKKKDYLLVNSSKEEDIKPKYNCFKDADWPKILMLVVILALSTMFSIFKGGNSEYSVINVKLCSAEYWVLSFIMIPLILIAWVITSRYLYKKNQIDRMQGNRVEGDIEYTKKNIVILGALSIVAGTLASLLGIGGGMIKGPVLLQMGLSPDITAATSSYMILFTSASSAVQYILVGKLRLDYGIIYYIIGFVSCFLGTQTLIWIVNKYKRRSFIIFLIGAVITVSTILLVITESLDFIKYRNIKFDSICTPADLSPQG
ncbi:hypothetical protein CYY_006303 [Polysphondylium violaceum]|uniref:Transmembrane protein TauE like protein n=1 Tax=Polysphondylium violaceum TaxID=133409 RepID=A0A8J4PQQ2_9MYCE|nr:hypothetical protein CYY_006303 [Polysphondylium violaceum]